MDLSGPGMDVKLKERKKVFEKQIKIKQLSVWVIRKHQRTSSFHETPGKEPTVRKVFFLKISKKLRTYVVHQNQI